MAFRYLPPADAARRARARVGTLVRGKYLIEAVLGTGGMASVFRARHRTGHRVALKIVHADLAGQLDARSWIVREGILTNAVDHPGVPRVLDDDTTDDGAPMLVVDFFDGEALADHATRVGRRLPAWRVLDLAEPMLEILGAVHACGIVHCDVKPDNFLLSGSRLVLLDFGIARAKAVDLPPLPREIADAPTGTPEYMAPEQAAGRWDWVDARTDVYAVGATLHVLHTGRFAKDGESVRGRELGAARAPRSALGEIIETALAFDPEARFPSADAMRTAVRAARAGFGTGGGHFRPRAASGTELAAAHGAASPTRAGRLARAS